MTSITLEKIERQTEKAILAAVEIEHCAGRRGVKVWFPLSQIKINGDQIEVPAWLVKAKLNDISGGRPYPGGLWFN